MKMQISTCNVSLLVFTLMVVLRSRVDGMFVGGRNYFPSSTLSARLKEMEAKINDLDVRSLGKREVRSTLPPQDKRFWGGAGLTFGRDALMAVNREVGFHAIHTKTKVYRKGDIIHFNHVITNLGNAYSGSTFTCPEAGTYQFNLNILADTGSYIEAAIMHNDISVFKAISYNRAPNTYNQGGGSAILKLSVGDVIKVQMVEPMGSGETVLGGFSHFSGYLLKSSSTG